MDGAAVKELAERFRGPEVIESHIAYPHGWTVVDPATIAGPQPEALEVYTLGALRDYLKANRDDIDPQVTIVHVVSPQIVRVHNRLNEASRRRDTFLKANATNLVDGFLDKWLSIEQFIIGLQSRFVDTEERKQVLRLFGTVKQEATKTAIDDGTVQTVVAKAGVALVGEVAVPNPVALAPFRTFREVMQPSSLFVLRVQGGGPNALPQVGLFEADGGAWRLDAVGRVHDWLKHELPPEVAVLA